MTPDERGRFCSHCQKSVVDFTSWADGQLHKFFTTQKEDNVCGRLSSLQVNRDIFAQAPRKAPSLHKNWLAAGLLFLIGAAPADVIARPIADTIRTQQAGDKQTTDTSQKIRGQVLDEMNKPILGATVQVLQGGLHKSGTSTDEDGKYALTVANLNFADDAPNIEIHISYTSYFTQNLNISKDSLFKYITIILYPGEIQILEEVTVMTGGIPLRDKKPNFFRRSWAWVKRIF
jgi:hypothetical protein